MEKAQQEVGECSLHLTAFKTWRRNGLMLLGNFSVEGACTLFESLQKDQAKSLFCFYLGRLRNMLSTSGKLERHSKI